jgi:hypothetical protein
MLGRKAITTSFRISQLRIRQQAKDFPQAINADSRNITDGAEETVIARVREVGAIPSTT